MSRRTGAWRTAERHHDVAESELAALPEGSVISVDVQPIGRLQFIKTSVANNRWCATTRGGIEGAALAAFPVARRQRRADESGSQ